MSNGNNNLQPGQLPDFTSKECPLYKEPCADHADTCAWFSQVQMAMMGPLGLPHYNQVGMCVHQANLIVSSSPKPQMPAPQTINLGNLKGGN